jgi:hypothetical protein
MAAVSWPRLTLGSGVRRWMRGRGGVRDGDALSRGSLIDTVSVVQRDAHAALAPGEADVAGGVLGGPQLSAESRADLPTRLATQIDHAGGRAGTDRPRTESGFEAGVSVALGACRCGRSRPRQGRDRPGCGGDEAVGMVVAEPDPMGASG